jgi:hypothetical protein
MHPTYTEQAFIFLFIAAEFGFYVFLRQLVNLKEWISACESIGFGSVHNLRAALREGEERAA